MSKNIKVIAGLTIISTAMSISNIYADNQQAIVTAGTLNIRSGPSTSYKVILQVKKNNTIQILDKDKGWYKVKLSSGRIGWVSGQYINTNEDNPTSNNSINMQGKKGKVNVSSRLNVRKGPTTGYYIVSKLSNNAIVDLLEKSNDWYKIKLSNGTIGWVSADYITIYKESSTTNPTRSKPIDQSSKVQSIIKKAHEQLGSPYVWGAEGPNSFDCSGLVHYVYGQNGIKTPRVSRDQYKTGISVSKSNLQPGDLIFSSTDSSGRVTHVGIYAGDGKMIHAPNSNGVVEKVDINSKYWKSVYVGAKRII